MELLIAVWSLIAGLTPGVTTESAIPAPVTLHYQYRTATGTVADRFTVRVQRDGSGYAFEETSSKGVLRTHRFDGAMMPQSFVSNSGSRRVEMVRRANGYAVVLTNTAGGKSTVRRDFLEVDAETRIFYSIFFSLMGYDFRARRDVEFTPVDYRLVDIPRWRQFIAAPKVRVHYDGTETLPDGMLCHRLQLRGVGLIGSYFPGYDLWYSAAAPHYLVRTRPHKSLELAVWLEKVGD